VAVPAAKAGVGAPKSNASSMSNATMMDLKECFLFMCNTPYSALKNKIEAPYKNVMCY
jgi:hypothetical protein